MFCQHAVEKGGRVFLVIKDKDTPYRQIEWHGNIEELEKMVISGEITLTRKPATDLERRLFEANDRYSLVKRLTLIRDMETREEVAGTIQQAIDWVKRH